MKVYQGLFLETLGTFYQVGMMTSICCCAYNIKSYGF